MPSKIAGNHLQFDPSRSMYTTYVPGMFFVSLLLKAGLQLDITARSVPLYPFSYACTALHRLSMVCTSQSNKVSIVLVVQCVRYRARRVILLWDEVLCHSRIVPGNLIANDLLTAAAGIFSVSTVRTIVSR